jgi:hypothetical protein
MIELHRVTTWILNFTIRRVQTKATSFWRGKTFVQSKVGSSIGHKLEPQHPTSSGFRQHASIDRLVVFDEQALIALNVLALFTPFQVVLPPVHILSAELFRNECAPVSYARARPHKGLA